MSGTFNRTHPLQPFTIVRPGLGGVVAPPEPAHTSTPFGPWCFLGTEIDTNLFGGTFTDTQTGFGGTALTGNRGGTVVNDTYGGTVTNVNSYTGAGITGYGGSFTDINAGLGGTDVDTNNYGGTANAGCFVTMQSVNITLGEFNDEVINLTVTNNSAPFDLTSGPGYTLKAFLKVSVGDLDSAGSTKTYVSTGGSPPIVVTNGPGGLATWTVPHADLQNATFTFWRLDVVTIGTLLNATAMYGTVSVKPL